ncbi:uncharacterized protein LOC141529291 [Cotesia typhae]|uniref:uncharacterized protein LOC141529291 n=1 Tax=Cotesia typhae TaxID=2053667 RepID=UPI003D68A882
MDLPLNSFGISCPEATKVVGDPNHMNAEVADEELQYHYLTAVTEVTTQSLPWFPDQLGNQGQSFDEHSLSQNQKSIENPPSESEAVQCNINQFDLIEIYKSGGLNPEPPLLTLLWNHPQGFNVNNSYKLNGTLTKVARNLLARLIIHKEHENKSTVDCLSAQRYLGLTKNICALFKSAIPNTYYTPHAGANGGIGAKSAYGILLSCNNPV